MKRLLLIFPIMILFVACEQVIDFDGKQEENKLVLNTVVSCTNDVHVINLSTSAFLFSQDDIAEMEGLPVEVKINGLPVEVEAVPTRGAYKFNAELNTGDKIEISVSDNQYGTVLSRDIVPEPPVITSVDTVRFYDNDSQSLYMRTLIKIKDKPVEKNYYRLLIKRIRTYREEMFDGSIWEHSEEETGYFVNQDIVLSALSREGKGDDNNISRIFSDDLFQGEEYMINVYFPLATGSHVLKENVEIEIELQSLTESLYLYLRSLEQKWNSDIFDQPIRVYSNVEGGYGILGICNSTEKNIVVD
jgi:hypothetical protein